MTCLWKVRPGRRTLNALCPALLVGFMLVVPTLPLITSKPVQADFLDADHELALVFFGFARCGSVCPTTLSTLARMPPDLLARRRLGVYFVDLDVGSTTIDATRYARRFDASFHGISPSTGELARLTDRFGLDFDADVSTHLGKLYLLRQASEKDWRLVRVYAPGSFSAPSLARELAARFEPSGALS